MPGTVATGFSLTRLASWLCVAAGFCLAILLGLPGAIYAPDSTQYRMLALGQRSLVPLPFSGRVLGPALAGWMGHVTGLGADAGFLFLGVVCLAVLIALIATYFWLWRAPFPIFAAVFLMPFWLDLFHDYYLPDLLYGTLLAALLACLFYGRAELSMLLLFPAFLARESTILVVFCLAIAGWRRLPRRAVWVGLVASIGGRLASTHFAQGGPASVHGLGGGGYMLGKVLWSLSRNVLGLPLWSNTLPECEPIWASSLPDGLHAGAIHAVGLCQPSLWGPGRLALAWFGVFGLGPAFAFALWRSMLHPSALRNSLWRRFSEPETSGVTAYTINPAAIVVFRFCLIYGLLNILLAPMLGASIDRLVEYGWPLFLIVLPWFISRSCVWTSPQAAGVVCLHLCLCWLAWYGFRQQTTGFALTGAVVLIANAAVWFALQKACIGYQSAPR